MPKSNGEVRMSKKSKRSTRSSSAPRGTVASVSAGAQSLQTASPSGRVGEKGFNPDYSDVIKDLKRIGTLAGTFFVIMVILSFFLK
jgi:hypothetical protein